ncbi:hypothetical protein [Streptomyces sp. V3I7]|uniref:hypothetical protein n=1 Tax=Streptomyces sp. V3I7 TaxID=3042278 RepID=UPI002786993F|nr:hypothetical protein [Streptomyces sp. V3I7]MDQ0994703.1 hypothetical protein [Streptomyces sp. V3I7]
MSGPGSLTRATAATGTTAATTARWRARRLRGAHPVAVLRALRAGTVVMVLVTALMYLLVSVEADRQVAAARCAHEAVEDVEQARAEAVRADQALAEAVASRQVPLIGTGSRFTNATARVSSWVTQAAEGNAAGREGLIEFQFVQGQLTTCVRLADTAVRDYDRTKEAGMGIARAALTAKRARGVGFEGEEGPIRGTGGLTESLIDLEDLQQSALTRLRGSGWLDPVLVWSLLLVPVAVLLGLVLATGYVVARHFRRYPSPCLAAALLITTGVAVGTGLLVHSDTYHLPRDAAASSPATMACALILLSAAGALVHLGYRPRLAEYTFPDARGRA